MQYDTDRVKSTVGLLHYCKSVLSSSLVSLKLRVVSEWKYETFSERLLLCETSSVSVVHTMM